MLRVSRVIGLLALLVVCADVSARVTVVRFGRLIDGRGAVIADAVVRVEGERIVSLTSGGAVPADATVIDLRRYTGLPGLIDAHTHMTFVSNRTPGKDIARRHSAATLIVGQENLRKTLETGVTTVRDLGSSEYLDVAMRDLINQGFVVGPRMLVSGYGIRATRSRSRERSTPPDPGQADGADEVIRVARQQIAAGVDWIKVYGSTGGGSDVSGYQTFSYEEMKAAVDVAHRAGKRIAIHSYGPDGAIDAVRAGADSVEHATDMGHAAMQEMAKRGTFYVPTIDHNRYYIDHREEYFYDDAAVRRLNDYIARNLQTLKRAVRAKVRVVMGSDAVYSGFGQNTRELEWFVKAGMTPAEALATATTNGAALLGMEKELGAIAPGFYADIIAVEGDPLADIGAVVNGVRWVMKGGRVVVDRVASPLPRGALHSVE